VAVQAILPKPSDISERKLDTTMNTIPLYRPYLSLEEIEKIISTLDQSTLLYKKLVEFQVKIRFGIIKPATTVTKKVELSESLGFSVPSDPVPTPVIYMPELTASPQVTYDTLATKALDGSITELEKSQGSELEMKLFGFNSGIFE